jgi:hypothetical protein
MCDYECTKWCSKIFTGYCRDRCDGPASHCMRDPIEQAVERADKVSAEAERIAKEHPERVVRNNWRECLERFEARDFVDECMRQLPVSDCNRLRQLAQVFVECRRHHPSVACCDCKVPHVKEAAEHGAKCEPKCPCGTDGKVMCDCEPKPKPDPDSLVVSVEAEHARLTAELKAAHRKHEHAEKARQEAAKRNCDYLNAAFAIGLCLNPKTGKLEPMHPETAPRDTRDARDFKCEGCG